nr:helveticin J family class III bacteriocin [Lactobacillus helsingborgensis]
MHLFLFLIILLAFLVQIILCKSIGYNANERANEYSRFSVNLIAWKGIDISHKHTEIEGIQVIDKVHAYVAVAHHALAKGLNKTVLNMIYELSWY